MRSPDPAESVVTLAARYQQKHGKGLTDAEWEYLRSEPCGMCDQPYHRYCDHDPEHEWNGVACINSLQARTEALIAALREARTLIGSGPYMGDIEYDAMFPGTDRLSQRIDALLPPEPQR